MTLTSGTKLGPYEIVAPLGAGGMGEVYRTRDARLARDVALKVLPAGVADDPSRRARFEQEARSASALNHPNIVTVFDMGAKEGVAYIVTELVEGEPLRALIDRGPVQVRKLLDIAVQLADGLAAAHAAGIVHRDLKPENIMLTREGRVKILDFGLAKQTAAVTPPDGRTASVEQTQPGTILGTVSYMSPEQARGATLDFHSDQFSFGLILYEGACGKKAFQKPDSVQTLAAIMTEDPPPLDAKLPGPLRWVIDRCLTKEPRERYDSTRDLYEELRSLRDHLSESFTPDSGAADVGVGLVPSLGRPQGSPLQKWYLWVLTGTLAVGLAVSLFLLRKASAPALPDFHQLTFDRGLIYSARFALEGHSIYYSAGWNGQPIQLYATQPNSPESRALDLKGSTVFAVSSSELAISLGCNDLLIGDCEGTLAVVPLSGGAPREVADNVVSADWTPDGSELAAIREVGGKFQVEFPLGKVIYKNANWLNFLRVSPRGDAIAFAKYDVRTGDEGHVVIIDPRGRQITQSRTFVSVEGLAWDPGGRELWCGASLPPHGWAEAIHALSLSGKERVVLRLPGMLRLHDISPEGRILLSEEVWRDGMQFRRANDPKERDLSWLDDADVTDLSPDGKDVAFFEWAAASTSSFTYMRRTDGAPAVKLGEGELSVFSPDGKWVLTNLPGDSPQRLELLPTGAGEPRYLNPFGIQQFATPGWMPDGREMYFAGNDGHAWRMYTQELAGGALRAFTPPISVEPMGYESHLVSPDGKFAFARDLNGKGWFYPLAGGEPRAVPKLVPEDIWVNWSSDGRSAYVYQNDKTHAQLFRIDLSTGKRQLLTELGPSDPAGLTAIVPVRITPDGNSYAYSYDRALSDLFLVSGVK